MERTKHGHKLPEPILGDRTAGQVKLQATEQPQEPQMWLDGGLWRPLAQSLQCSTHSGNSHVCLYLTHSKS